MKTNIKLIAAMMMATAMLFSACKKEEETSETSNTTPGVPATPNTPPDVPATPTVTNATFTFDGQTVQLGSLSTKVKHFTTSYGTNGQRLVIDAASTEKPAGCTMNMPTFHIVIEQVGGDATWRIIDDSTYAYTADMLADVTQRNYFTEQVDAQTVRPVKPNYIHYSSSQFTDRPVNSENKTVSINCQITFQGVYEMETTHTYNPQDLKYLSVSIQENPYTE